MVAYARVDVPEHVAHKGARWASFLLPPCAPPLVTIKGRGGKRLQGLDLHRIEHHLKGLGLDTLS
jgi:hypothetical protein